MKEPGLVADCVSAMRAVVKIPVTVKHRIGIEFQKNRDSPYSSYEHMKHFVEEIAKTGCKTFIVHARIAILGGLSPKQNRDIPPLQYKLIYKLKQELPHLNIILNGGIMTLDHAASELNNLDGVMIGREAYSNPMIFQEADSKFYDSVDQNLGRFEILNLNYQILKDASEFLQAKVWFCIPGRGIWYARALNQSIELKNMWKAKTYLSEQVWKTERFGYGYCYIYSK